MVFDETCDSSREDLLDQHVAYFMKQHPEVHSKHTLVRTRPGVYNFDGREISVEWQYSDEAEQPGYLIAVDGPLRQPFADYMEDNENGVTYDDKRLGKSALSQVPKGKRLSFGDSNKAYSRLEAMKVAKEQALIREKACEYACAGMAVPQHELMAKYNKTISQKLGGRGQRPTGPQPENQQMAQAPAEAPVASPPPSASPTPQTSPAPSPKASGNGKQQTHGAPKYCAKHDETQKRKKCKPKNLPCSSCQTVIQTNYVEFTICPTCSEKDHRCMCCGCAAVGHAAPPPQTAPSSPMHARGSPQQRRHSKEAAHMSPMNLFGMPDIFSAGAKAQTSPEPAAFNGTPGTIIQSPWAGLGQMMPAQNNAFVSSNGYASQAPVASQNAYASQNAFASYNPTAPQQVVYRN